MEHRPPTDGSWRPAPHIPAPDDQLRKLLGRDDDPDPDLVSTAAELTGVHLVGDDAVLELVLPRDAYEELELKAGSRYDLSEVVDDGRHVPVILSSTLALTAAEVDDFRALAVVALQFLGSVSLAVDEHADERPWAVITTFDGQPGTFVARGDSPAEALHKAALYHWDEVPEGTPGPTIAPAGDQS